MLTANPSAAGTFFDDLRRREFARLDAQRMAYLDYAGSALYAESHVAAHRALLAQGVFGNPHSANGASDASTVIIEAARQRVLRFLDAGDDYDVCFTANASAAIKLVAEAYPFGPSAPFLLSSDNHNSVNGTREFARRAGAAVHYLPLANDLTLLDPEARIAEHACAGGLLAFPAQSNFSGVQHPLALVAHAQRLGCRVLLDAAAFVPSHRLSLRHCPADFVALSFYKVFGYPTGVGALVARRDALAALKRPWFAGGTVEFVSVQLERHQLRALHEAFEDGTPNFLDIAALEPGFTLYDTVGVERLTAHVESLAASLVDAFSALHHRDGSPVVRMYGVPSSPNARVPRGATVAFNVIDPDGRAVPFALVEKRASDTGVMLRGGCFCNPGASEAAFRLDKDRMAHCFDATQREFTLNRLQQCIGPETSIGAVRASIGMANNLDDIRRAAEVIASFAV